MENLTAGLPQPISCIDATGATGSRASKVRGGLLVGHLSGIDGAARDQNLASQHHDGFAILI